MATKPLKTVIKWLYGHSELPVLLVGEGASGKTTFLSQLLHGRAVYAIPTMGHHLTRIEHSGCTFSIWDTGSRSNCGYEGVIC